MSEIDSFKVKPRQAKELIIDCIQSGNIPFLRSSPGIGKSSIFRAVAQHFHLAMIDHRMAGSAPEDMNGLPLIKEDGADMVPFHKLFPLENAVPPEGKQGWMVFLDELNSAQRETLAASYKLLLDRMVGQSRLNQRVAITAAGNLATDRAIVNPMGSALESRVIHLELMCDFKEWLEDVAITQGYDGRIIAYLSQWPSKLMDFNPAMVGARFCCPRTWEFMNNFLKVGQVPVTPAKTPLFAGTISSSVATEFVAFCQIYKELPKIEDILAAPDTMKIPHEASHRYAITTMVAENITAENCSKLMTYMKRMDTSFRILNLRMVTIRKPKLQSHDMVLSEQRDLIKYMTS